MPIFSCQGLPNHGVILTAPTAPEFPFLLEAIRRRSRDKLEGAPPSLDPDALTQEDLNCSAVLLNYSNKTIQDLNALWISEYDTRPPQWLCRTALLANSELIPFRPKDPVKSYWNVILPGSIRLLTREGLIGDNRDIRLPRPEELHTGHWSRTSDTGTDPFWAPKVQVTIDGVLFENGEFVGDDRCAVWPQLQAEVEVKSEAARIAKSAVDEDLSTEEALTRVLDYVGQGGAQRDAADLHKQILGNWIARSPEQALVWLLQTAELPQLSFRRAL